MKKEVKLVQSRERQEFAVYVNGEEFCAPFKYDDTHPEKQMETYAKAKAFEAATLESNFGVTSIIVVYAAF